MGSALSAKFDKAYEKEGRLILGLDQSKGNDKAAQERIHREEINRAAAALMLPPLVKIVDDATYSKNLTQNMELDPKHVLKSKALK